MGDTTLIKMDNTELVEENGIVGVTFQTGTKRYFPYQILMDYISIIEFLNILLSIYPNK